MAACMNISREFFTEHGPLIRSCTIALKEVINPSLEPHTVCHPSVRGATSESSMPCTLAKYSIGFLQVPTATWREFMNAVALPVPEDSILQCPLYPLALAFLLPCLCSLSFREGHAPFRVVHSTVAYSLPFDTCESLHYSCPLQRTDSLRKAESSTNK